MGGAHPTTLIFTNPFKTQLSTMESTMENQINATHWVIACGSDCDGYYRADVSQFASENEAQDYAERRNEWSDGVRYIITNNLEILRNYCEDYNMDWTYYTHITNLE